MSILPIIAETQDTTGEWHYISMKGYPLSVKGNGATCPWIGQGTYIYTTKEKVFTIETYIKDNTVSLDRKPNIEVNYFFDSMSDDQEQKLKDLIIKKDDSAIITFVNENNLASYRLCCSSKDFVMSYKKWKSNESKKI